MANQENLESIEWPWQDLGSGATPMNTGGANNQLRGVRVPTGDSPLVSLYNEGAPLMSHGYPESGSSDIANMSTTPMDPAQLAGWLDAGGLFPMADDGPKATPSFSAMDIHRSSSQPAKKRRSNNPMEWSTTQNNRDTLYAHELLKALRARMPDSGEGQAACDYCRKRKIKCDRKKPTCGHCAQSGRVCTSDDVLRKRGPPSKKERAIMNSAGIGLQRRPTAREAKTATNRSTSSRSEGDPVPSLSSAAEQPVPGSTPSNVPEAPPSGTGESGWSDPGAWPWTSSFNGQPQTSAHLSAQPADPNFFPNMFGTQAHTPSHLVPQGVAQPSVSPQSMPPQSVSPQNAAPHAQQPGVPEGFDPSILGFDGRSPANQVSLPGPNGGATPQKDSASFPLWLYGASGMSQDMLTAMSRLTQDGQEKHESLDALKPASAARSEPGKQPQPQLVSPPPLSSSSQNSFSTPLSNESVPNVTLPLFPDGSPVAFQPSVTPWMQQRASPDQLDSTCVRVLDREGRVALRPGKSYFESAAALHLNDLDRIEYPGGLVLSREELRAIAQRESLFPQGKWGEADYARLCGVGLTLLGKEAALILIRRAFDGVMGNMPIVQQCTVEQLVRGLLEHRTQTWSGPEVRYRLALVLMLCAIGAVFAQDVLIGTDQNALAVRVWEFGDHCYRTARGLITPRGVQRAPDEVRLELLQVLLILYAYMQDLGDRLGAALCIESSLPLARELNGALQQRLVQHSGPRSTEDILFDEMVKRGIWQAYKFEKLHLLQRNNSGGQPLCSNSTLNLPLPEPLHGLRHPEGPCDVFVTPETMESMRSQAQLLQVLGKILGQRLYPVVKAPPHSSEAATKRKATVALSNELKHWLAKDADAYKQHYAQPLLPSGAVSTAWVTTARQSRQLYETCAGILAQYMENAQV